MQLKLNARHIYFYSACCLTVIGIIFIYSASEYWAKIHYANETPFYIKQIIYASAALLLFLFIVKLKIPFTYRFTLMLYVASIVLLIVVLIPGIGLWRNGSRSWIGVGGFTIQPAEIVKITALLFLSSVIANRKSYERIVQLKHFVIILLPCALIMLQPDFGSVFLLVTTSFTLLFISNYPWKIFISLITLGGISLAILIITAPYRLKRISAFLNPWEDPLGSGFQAVQSLFAIGPAGLFGHGFLKSRQKYLYLPEPQNDFIFSIIVEETGLFGSIIFITIFACFLLSGIHLAKKSIYNHHFLMIVSLQVLIAYQAILNIGVVVGLFPVTGVTLPFVSYGGTSLIFIWVAVAITLKLSKEKNE